MNELELFNEVSGQTTYMTTRELADVLGVDVVTITRTIKKLNAVLHSVQKNSQGGYMLTAEQAAQIKAEVQKHHNLKSRQIDAVSSKIEELGKVREAFEIITKWNGELMRERDELKGKAEAYDRFIDDKTLYSFRDAARLLGVGEKWLMSELKGKYIYEYIRADGSHTYTYNAYARYARYFGKRPFRAGGKIFTRLMMTLEGLEYFGRELGEKQGELE